MTLRNSSLDGLRYLGPQQKRRFERFLTEASATGEDRVRSEFEFGLKILKDALALREVHNLKDFKKRMVSLSQTFNEKIYPGTWLLYGEEVAFRVASHHLRRLRKRAPENQDTTSDDQRDLKRLTRAVRKGKITLERIGTTEAEVRDFELRCCSPS